MRMSGTSMAAPHVAGVAAVILGNARALTPSEVASRLSTDATTGVITGLNSSTINSLLYQRPTSNASSAGFGDEDQVDGINNDNESDSASMDYGNEVPAAAPVVVAPLARISSARQVGKNFRIVVTAPQGSRIVLYRNGKAIASGKKTSFSVSIGKAKSAQFHAVAVSGKSFLVTQKVTVGTRAQSTRK